MAIFSFDPSDTLGSVRGVDTRRVLIYVESDENLRKARVGQLVSLALPGPLDEWLIGIIAKVLKSTAPEDDEGAEHHGNVDKVEMFSTGSERVVNTVLVTLVGGVAIDETGRTRFTRSIVQVPEINGLCHVLRNKQLERFMGILSVEGKAGDSLPLGNYTIDPSAAAYVDGNKLFQRHAALLGSTGSGKSWTVAAILERAAQLPSSNLIVFDLHGEYRELSYVRHLRIPGPDELGKTSNELLYLPYWLLNGEELQAMFIDRSEFSAHNQVLVFQETVSEEKKKKLQRLGKEEVLNAFTVDSPIPFSIRNVLGTIRDLNEEMEQGTRGLKQGKFYGQFSRLLARIGAKLGDRRYGFLFQAPESQHTYDTMAGLVAKLMDYGKGVPRIKVIDFSEVPSEVLPVIVSLVARIIYQVQFWTDRERRKPLAFVCDEAHLYIARKGDSDPAEQRAIDSFEKIAKEGRKYGVSLVVVSQRPSDVSPTVLSQCNNIIALRLTNGADREVVRKLLPESLESLMDMLPILEVGEALVVGDSVLLPSRIRVSPPQEKPLSATIDFWTEWLKPADVPDFVRSVENMRRQSRK